LFGLVLFLSFALVIWWTTFLLLASGEMVTASERLASGDAEGAANALGADDPSALAELATRRQWMFATEGAFFMIVLLICGWLYLGSVRREEQLRRGQDRFLAAATHELKTPLATISLLLESLRNDRVPAEKLDRYLTNGLLEAERLERGLHNVLTAAGLRSAGMKTKPTVGNLTDDIRQAVDSMQARAHATDIDLHFDANSALSAPRDVAALQLVLRNLIDNAIKFSPAGSSIHVSLAAEGKHACIAVADNGRGLNAEELQQAFEPFFRGDDKASGGTGLGLHLVREMVVAHGGTTEVESAGRDKGCTFILRLPLEAAS